LVVPPGLFSDSFHLSHSGLPSTPFREPTSWPKPRGEGLTFAGNPRPLFSPQRFTLLSLLFNTDLFLDVARVFNCSKRSTFWFTGPFKTPGGFFSHKGLFSGYQSSLPRFSPPCTCSYGQGGVRHPLRKQGPPNKTPPDITSPPADF